MATKEPVIIEITDQDDTNNSVNVIRDSFQTVAEELNLTVENCPTHPSFITPDKLNELKSKGVKFYGLFTENEQAGFIAIEKSGRGSFLYREAGGASFVQAQGLWGKANEICLR